MKNISAIKDDSTLAILEDIKREITTALGEEVKERRKRGRKRGQSRSAIIMLVVGFLRNLLIKLKRIMIMPFPLFARKVYYLLKKPIPLPPGSVYDANINVMNIETYQMDGNLHFTGDVAPQKKSPVTWLTIYSLDVLLGKTKVTKIKKRLTFDTRVPFYQGHDVFEFYFEFPDGTKDHLGNLQLSYLLSMKEFEEITAEKTINIAPPPLEIVFLTQGDKNVDAYLKSVPQGVFKLKHIFLELGIAFKDMHTILDFGCGSGRLLRGLYAEGKGARPEISPIFF